MAADSSGSRDELTRQAEKYLRQGRTDQALECYQRLADLPPTDWNAVKQLADLCERAGQREAAATRFAQLADHLFHEGFHTKASALYKKVLKLDPTTEHAWWQLAELAFQQNLRVDARQAFTQVLDLRRRRQDTSGVDEVLLRLAELDPDDVKARAAAALVVRADEPAEAALDRLRQVAVDLDEAGDIQAADEVWRDVLERQPDDADLRLRLIRRALDQDDLAAALPLVDGLRNDVPEQFALRVAIVVRAGRTAELRQLVAGRVAAGQQGRDMLEWVRHLNGPQLRESCVAEGVHALRQAGATQAAGELITGFAAETPDAAASLYLLWVELCVDSGLDQLDDAQHGLASAYLREGLVAEARAVAEDLVLRLPDDSATRELLVEIYRAGGDADPDATIARLQTPVPTSEPQCDGPTEQHEVTRRRADETSFDVAHYHGEEDPTTGPPPHLDVPTYVAVSLDPAEPGPTPVTQSEPWELGNRAAPPPPAAVPSTEWPLASWPASPQDMSATSASRHSAAPVSSMDAWLAEVTSVAPVKPAETAAPAAAAGFDWSSLLGREVQVPGGPFPTAPRATDDVPWSAASLPAAGSGDMDRLAAPDRMASDTDANECAAHIDRTTADFDAPDAYPSSEDDQCTAALAVDDTPVSNGDADAPGGEAYAAQPAPPGDVESSSDESDAGQRAVASTVPNDAEGPSDPPPAGEPIPSETEQQSGEDEEIDLTELLEQLKQFDPVLPEMRPRTPVSETASSAEPHSVDAVQHPAAPAVQPDLPAHSCPDDAEDSSQHAEDDAGTDPAGAPGETGADEDLAAVFADMQERTGDRTLASQQLAAGRVFAAAGLAAEAARAFERASSELRSRFEAGQALAELHRSRGQLVEAVRWYEVAASAPVADAAMRRAVLYDLSETLESLGETERALGVVLDLLSEVEDYRDARARADRLLSVDAGG